MCGLLGLYVAAQADLEETLGTIRMSSTRLAPCRSSASLIGSMYLTSTRLLIVSFFPDFELGSHVLVSKASSATLVLLLKLTELEIQFVFLI